MNSPHIIEASKGQTLSFKQLINLVIKLSIPAILAEISSIVMQYIDAAMVGNLGANASAAIGLVSSSTWLLGGLCIAVASGFSVQVAHLIGAKRNIDACNILKQSLIVATVFGFFISFIGISISGVLPKLLGGATDICSDASHYFFIYCCALPAIQLRQLAGGILQSSGDMKTPSILNVFMCCLDVILNFLLIFPTRNFYILGLDFTLYGAGLGVIGASLGTALSEITIALIMLYAVCFRSSQLNFKHGGSWRLNNRYLKNAIKIAFPIAIEHVALCSAQIASTRIVAPLGTVSVAANSLAVTAESFCYMPGYGIGSAATTLVGQSIGTKRLDLAKKFARISVILGIIVMSCCAIFMFIFAPYLFSMLTPVEEIRTLGTQVLRIEAFAEPMYAASIVTAGALRGAGDTFIPSILNLVSMWGVRITAAAFLAPHFGLHGVWIAMCVELCIRGILFLIRLLKEKWLNINISI